ncbi:MAG: hypothetical protein U0Q10_14295 [Dermatophilaceae bacterium]
MTRAPIAMEFSAQIRSIADLVHDALGRLAAAGYRARSRVAL